MDRSTTDSPSPLNPSLAMISASCSAKYTQRRMVLFAPLMLLLLAPASMGQSLLQELSAPEPQGGTNFGLAVAGVTDADGDGRGDILVGAREQVHLFSGATGALLHTILPPDSARSFGTAVAGVPDVNGDGRTDLLVGASLTFGAFDNAGRVYLFSGTTGSRLRTLDSPDPHFDGMFGRAVTGVQDVDGDGRGDLLIGSRDAGGQAYLFSGATGLLLDTLFSPDPMSGDNFGAAVAAVPDTDGDGLDDLLIGAFAGMHENIRSGRAYLFSGATRALLHTLDSPDPKNFGDFGEAVAGVPDVDGDGRGDLLIGAPQENGSSNLTWAGRAYLFSGTIGALLRSLDSPNPGANDRFGISVSGTADVDGDERGDILVGAFFEDETGRAYAFSGATGALLQPLDSPNPDPVGLFGSAIATLPDANGDGRDDFLVGAPQENGGGFNAGQAYLYSGAGAPAVALAATADQTTVMPGGTITFPYTITNASAPTTSGDLFFTAERGGSPVALGIVRSGTLPNGASVAGSYTQQVPAGALPGIYLYTLRVGSFPDVTVDAETFAITVVGAARNTEGMDRWSVVQAMSPVPGFHAVHTPDVAATAKVFGVEAYPNPFQDRTTLRFTLNEATQARLAVYDVLGREVAVLHDGPAETGNHSARFEADGLASGVYVWRFMAGARIETGRLTLVR